MVALTFDCCLSYFFVNVHTCSLQAFVILAPFLFYVNFFFDFLKLFFKRKSYLSFFSFLQKKKTHIFFSMRALFLF